MMKKIKPNILIYLVLFVLVFCNCQSADAAVIIDTERNSSITIQYSKEGIYCDGMEIKTYRIADVNEQGGYILYGDFKTCSINLNNVHSQTEWTSIADTLAAHAISEKVSQVYEQTTDNSGVVSYLNLKPGLYLTLAATKDCDDKIIAFENFITALPYYDSSTGCDYDVTVYPKGNSFIVTPDETEYKVIKQWKDQGYEKQRPENIKVNIYKNGEFVSTQQLDSTNNWTYRWKAPEDGAIWTVDEKGTHEGYDLSITEKNKTIVLTNTIKDVPPADKEDNIPKTGDTMNTWPLLIAMCLSGGILLIFAIWRKRTE